MAFFVFQTAAAGTFADDLVISIARSQSYGLAFYNVCSGVRFKLSTEGVKSVTIKGNDGEVLAGRVKVSFDGSGIPQIDEVIDPKTEVTVTCANGFAVDTWYYIVTLPATFTNGLTFTLSTDDKEAEKVLDREITLRRAVFGSISSLDDGLTWKGDVPAKPAANQIFYTSSDEAMVSPFNDSFYDANDQKISIVSNKYTNGRGVITFASDVVRVGEQAFYNRPMLMSITFPEGLIRLDSKAITDNIRLETIEIPKSVTYIGSYCFQNNTKLASVPSLGSLTSIPEYLFYGCSGLISYNIPEGVTSIGKGAFYDCTSLTSITIPEGVTYIGREAFLGCRSLTSITIPEGMTSIGSHAFYGCTSLKIINCKATTPPSIDSYTLSNCNPDTIYVPENSVNAYKAADYWSSFASKFQGYTWN